MNRRLGACLLGVGLLVTACGRSAGPTSASATGGVPGPPRIAPTAAGYGRTGSTVTVHLGQTLFLRLGSRFAVPAASEASLRFPRALLSFSSGGLPSGTYTFKGQRVGTGRIWITSPGCVPGPDMGMQPLKPNCAAVSVQGGGGSSGSLGHPTWLFAATVHVVPLAQR
jgi:hypothetical protein